MFLANPADAPQIMRRGPHATQKLRLMWTTITVGFIMMLVVLFMRK